MDCAVTPTFQSAGDEPIFHSSSVTDFTLSTFLKGEISLVRRRNQFVCESAVVTFDGPSLPLLILANANPIMLLMGRRSTVVYSPINGR